MSGDEWCLFRLWSPFHDVNSASSRHSSPNAFVKKVTDLEPERQVSLYIMQRTLSGEIAAIGNTERGVFSEVDV